MSQTFFKAQAMARRFKQQMMISLAGLTIAESLDSDGYPVLSVAKGSGGTLETLYVLIQSMGNAGRVDGLGMPQRAYSPHKVVIIRENHGGAAVEPKQLEMREKVTAESVKLGAKVEIWEREDVSNLGPVLTGAAKLAEIDPDPVHKLTNSQ